MGRAPDRVQSLDSAALAEELLAPLRLRNAGEQIADRLVTAIALGVFVPGQRLPPERDLATSLDVSRTTVREAISRLAATGYVEVRRGRNGGALVLTAGGSETNEMIRRTLAPGWEQLDQLFDFRTLVEPLIAKTAAARRDGQALERIQQALADYQSAGSDREASSRADGALHRAIAEATANPYLIDLSDRIRQGVSLGFRAEPYSPAIRAKALIEHAELTDAIAVGDVDRAATLAGHHFASTEERLREVYARSAPEPEPTGDSV
jgi:GntR family transcriptional repressor for pyruvate dehydrogenase complex